MATPDWYLDELGHAGEEHLDPSYVPGYDAKAETDPAGDVALLRELGLGPGDTLVDLGAGTGTLAVAAAPHCRRVVAADVSPAMLAALRQKAERAGARNVEAVQAGLLTYEHQGEPAGFVYSRHALHHLPDQWKAVALARVAGALREGGVFVLRDIVFSCAPQELGEVVEGWLGRASGTPQRGWTRAELVTHMRTEHSTFSWLLEPMLERAGLRVLRAEHSPSRIYASYVCARR